MPSRGSTFPQKAKHDVEPFDEQEIGDSPNASGMVFGGVAAVLLIVVIGFVAHRGFLEYRLQSGIRFAEQATAALESGDLDRAKACIRTALRLAPIQVDVQRRAAHLFGAIGDANAFIFWHNLFLLEDPKSEDVMAFVDWCRRVGRQELVTVLLPDRDDPEIQLARALTTTNVFERVTVLDKLAQGPSDTIRFEVALQGCISTNLDWVRIGRGRMLGLARSGFEPAQMFLLTQKADESRLAATALERLAPAPWLPKWKPVADHVVRGMPLAEAVRDQAVSDLGIATFLRRHNMSLLRPDWLKASRTNYPLFLLQAEQMADSGQWKDLFDQCAQTNRWMLQEVRNALSMLAQDRLGRPDQAFQFRTAALVVSRGRPARLLNLLGFAMENSLPDLSAAALRELCQLPGWREKASRLLFELGVARRHLPWMVEGSEYLAKDNPQSPWYGTWIYGKCLLLQGVGGLAPPEGDAPDILLARALLFARQGQPDRAVDAVEAIPVAYRNVHWQVTAAYVYRVANQRARSTELIRKLDLDQCFDEERYLLELPAAGIVR